MILFPCGECQLAPGSKQTKLGIKKSAIWKTTLCITGSQASYFPLQGYLRRKLYHSEGKQPPPVSEHKYKRVFPCTGTGFPFVAQNHVISQSASRSEIWTIHQSCVRQTQENKVWDTNNANSTLRLPARTKWDPGAHKGSSLNSQQHTHSSAGLRHTGLQHNSDVSISQVSIL